MSDQLRYLKSLNCLDEYMECYQWARSIPLDKFNETHFLADIDIFLSQLKNQKTSGETLCEVQAAAKAYAKNLKQIPRDKAVEKTRKYLKDNELLAVTFDKGVGFCIMRKQTYESKLDQYYHFQAARMRI